MLRRKLETPRMLVLSTTHIPEYAVSRRGWSHDWLEPVNHGWLMRATVITQGTFDIHLGAVLAFAQNAGCDYVLFDQDGPVIDELETFDW